MDDTLYPEEQYVFSGFRAVSRWAEEALGILHEQAFLQLQGLFNQGIRGNTFNFFLAENGLDEEGLIAEMVTVYRDHTPELSPFPEVMEVLQYLALRYQLGLITDGYLDVQQKKWAALGLDIPFEAVIFSDQWGRENWKPSHRPYTKAMEICGTIASETIYVGDNPKKDFLGARQLGMGTVMVRRPAGVYRSVLAPTSAHAPDIKIENLKQLIEIVEDE